jgi:hypothetical protein
MNMSNSVQLINEALSRARMPKPQDVPHSEAHRSARLIAMRARGEQNRQLGL